MIILDSASKSLQLLLGAAVTANQLSFIASYIDANNTGQIPGSNDGLTNNGSAVTLIPAPTVSTQRQVKSFTIQNADTASAKVSILYSDNGITRNIFVATLNAGDNLIYEDAYGFSVFDNTGALKQSGSAGSGSSSSNAVTSVAGRTGNVILSVTDLFPLALPKWHTALGRVRAGTGNARWLMAGDSTTKGHGALGNPNVGNFKYTLAAFLSNMFNADGINSHYNSFFGGGGTLAPSIDSRVTSSGTFASENGGPSLGGGLLRADNTGQLSFTPTVNVDTFEIYYYQGPSLGSFSCNINSGTASTVTTAGTASMQTKVITGALGSNTVNVNWVSGGSVFICGIRAYDSSKKWLEIDNCGVEGVTAAGWLGAGTNAYDPITAAVNVAPDLISFCLGINDWDGGTSIAAYTASMQSLITTAKTTSDVVLITPTPSQVGYSGFTPATTVQQTYVNALFGLAQTNGIPIIDIYGRWGSYTAMNALGNYFDGLHPDSTGYGDQAQAMYNVLKAA